MKPIVDDEEEEIPIKRQGLYATKKCECPFKLKGEQMATSENWQLFVHNRRHSHKIAVYYHGHAQAARLMEDAQKIYNVVAKIKKNRMQGRNTVEEVLRLSTKRGYKVFYRNREESNVLSDIVVAHPTSIAMIRMYNMPLLEAVGMTPTGKNFTVATAFMCNEQATIYRWVFQQIKHLYVTYAMVWISQVLHFGVETTNRAESEHSVLKLWLSTCHGDLDTMFLNIDSLIEGQIAEIKSSLEISKLKEKYAAKSNAILKNISNKISHLALKKIWLKIKKAHEMVEDRKEEDVYIFWRKLEIGADIPDVQRET
ncbi:hypothetical protein M9H77_22011 [Catharanthus roseus]|uniref:Uncharacterized protein n=1 Tax=Catharanthus roseus TaxID=4058 RepID=A0ACC0ARW5_CATRO|nr:hypothetical protein M9H77_22011 [Catharanthus roseus]